MKYQLKYHKNVLKFFKKHHELSEKIIKNLEILSQNPFDNTLDIKPLQGLENHYRLRVGKYRILYEVIENTILIYVYKVSSRGDAYK